MFVNVVAASLGASQSQRDGLTLMTEALSSVAAGKPTVVHTLFLLLQPKPFSAPSLDSTSFQTPKTSVSVHVCQKMSPLLIDK